jgi:hypothetical protein
MLAVARAYDELAGIASELADAIQSEDRSRGGRTAARAALGLAVMSRDVPNG